MNPDYENLKEEIEEWEEAECMDCGMAYGQAQEWQHYCPVCFKLDRGYKILVGDRHIVWLQQELLDERTIAEEEIEALKDAQKRLFKKARSLKEEVREAEEALEQANREFARLERDYERSRRVLAHKLAMGRNTRSNYDEFYDKIMDLVKLCHPDKHANSARATEMTKWLLSQR